MKEWDEEAALKEQALYIEKYMKKASTARANILHEYPKLDREDQLSLIKILAERLKHR